MSAHVITVAQQKGGAGKTTVAAQLAVRFALDGHRVALLDIDPQKSLARWFAQRAAAGNAPAGGAISLSDVAGWKVGTELDRLRRDAEVVIIDSPPHAETEARVAVRSADLVLVPLQPSPMDLWATAPTIELARREKVPLLVVLNRVAPRGRVVDAMCAAVAEQGLPLAGATLGNRTAFAASMMEGLGVAESDRRSRAADEIRALADEVMSRMKAAA